MKNLTKFISTLSLFLFITINAFAHSPCGDSVGLQTWYKADAGITLLGRTFTAWNDQSGHGFNTPQGSFIEPKFINAAGNSGNGIRGESIGAGQAGVLSSFNGGTDAEGKVILASAGSAPTITAISANICAGGSITITGTNLLTATSVTIGGTAVSSITSNTSTQIIAVVSTACSGNVQVTTSGGTAASAGTFTCYAIPAAPTVTTPINYCLNATASQLTATGSNLTWGSGSISGTAGGTTTYSALTYISNSGSNKKTNFTTTASNVEITSVDYYVPANQSIAGVSLALYNSSGTVIATSSTVTSLSSPSSLTTITNIFNYTIASPGNYSIGISTGTGTIGGDSTISFPITEATGTINVTGTTSPGGAAAPFHCFNNIQFTVNNGGTAPTPSTSVAGTTNYLVSQTISGCVSPQASIAVIINNPPSATISYSGTPFCKSVATAQAVSQSGTSGGTYSASPSGLSINASTGAITPSSSTAGTYTVTYTMAAAGGCSAQTATTSVTITALPSAAISYSGTPFCKSVATVQAVTQSGTSGGTYSASPSGLSINTSTGAITPSSSTVGTYTVTYTMTAGGCSTQTATTSVTITALPSATISYGGSPFCKSVGTAQAVTQSGTSGGTYSASPSGLSINGSTGAITPSTSTAGTYTVTYSMAATGGCSAQTATTSVTITAIPSATISYGGTPYCQSVGTAQAVTQSGTSGGTYSASPSGLSINTSTGAITPSTSTAGTYTVTYTMTASGCSAQTATTSVTITALPSATISYVGAPFCKSVVTAQAVTQSGTTGGTYSSTSGLSLNASTGAITPSTSTAGTYTVTYTMTASGCSAQTATTSVTITALPSATISYVGTPFCQSVVTAQAVTQSGTSGGTYSASPSGLSINASNGAITPSSSTAGTYTVTYTIPASGGCAVYTTTTSLTVSALSVGGSVGSNATVCSGTNSGTVNLTGQTGNVLNWQYSTDGGTTWTSIANTTTSQAYNNLTQTTLYRAVVQSGVCSSANSSAATITVNAASEGGSVSSNATVCSGSNSGTVNLTGQTGSILNWQYSTDGGTTWTTIANTTTSLAYSNLTQTTQYRAVVQSGVCFSANSSNATITVNPVSVGGTVGTSTSVCTGTNSGTLNLTGNTGSVVNWQYSTNGGTSWTDIVNTSTSQTYSNITQTTQYTAVVQSGVCSSANSSAATITVNPATVGGTVGNDSTVCSGANTGTVYLTGQTGSVVKWQYSSDGGTSWTDIANTTTSQTFNSLTQTTIGEAVVQSGVCPSVNSSPVTITVNPAGSWAGSVSADWNDSRNWLCGAIPTSTLNVMIPSGASHYPIITSGIDYANNVTIQSGGSLTVAGGDLQIFGAITNNSGTFDATSGTIEMKGAAAQTIDGSAFYKNTINNLIVSNSGSGLSVSSTASDTLKITGTLTFGNSGSTLNTGGNITLVSNSAGTASVGIVGSGNTINGNVTVERYINVGTAAGQHAKSWQFLATPTIGQTVKQSWMENGATPVGYGTQITGAGGTAAGFDAYTASPSLKYYAPASDSWTGVTGTGISIYNPSGYMVFVRGDRSVTSVSQPANTTTLRTKGALLTGTLAPISVSPNEYASIGNPYASPVDFTLITKGAAIDDQFYVWDPYLYGSYGVGGYQTLSSANEFEPVPGGTTAYPSGTPYYILQSGQAIFVHSTSNPSYTASDYNLTFSEIDKSNSTSANFSRMSGLTPPSGRAFFGVSLYTGNTIADGNTVAFDRSFSDNIDGNDALKLTNGGENFGLKRDGKLLAIEARSPVVVTDTLYYYMTNLQQQTYQLRFAPVNMVASGLQAFLIDNFLNTSTPVSLSDSSFINITVTSNPASSASGRFDVVFRTLSITPVTFTSISAVQKNADIEVDWSVENESGIQQYEVEESGDGNQFTQVATVAPQNNGSGNYSWLDLNVTPGYHYYRVRSVGKDGQVQYTQIVKVLIGKMDASFSVYPNPIVNGNIHLAFNNEPAGVYGVRLMNSLGQLIVLKVINHGGGNSMEEITPSQTLAKGIYQLEVTKPDGNVEVVKVVN